MGGPITPEATDIIDAAIEEALRECPDADVIEEPLRIYIRKRWPHILRAAVTQHAIKVYFLQLI